MFAQSTAGSNHRAETEECAVSNTEEHNQHHLGDESGIIVFGGGGSGGRGCAGRGCLFWIVVSVVLSVTLTVLVNLILFLFSGGGSGVGV